MLSFKNLANKSFFTAKLNEVGSCKDKIRSRMCKIRRNYVSLDLEYILLNYNRNMAEKTHNAELGELGENIAAEYLLGKGYKILERNWRFGHKEIDIIARDTGKNELVIVEVKTRKGKDMLLPGDLITMSKQRFLINAADAYIRWHANRTDTRFDVILIYFQNNGEYKLQHIPEAFYPTM